MGEISRRRFLGFAAGAAGALLLPQRTIFLPPRGGWISPIGAVRIPSYIDDGYSAGIASGKYTYDSVTQTMYLWRPEDVELDGKFHSPLGRSYDWTLDEKPGARAAVDDELDKPKCNQRLWNICREKTLKIEADPVINLPKIRDINKITWEHFPTSAQEESVMNALREEAIVKGLPIFPETYCLDENKLYETRHYKKWAHLRSRILRLQSLVSA